jgi:hypothetical protein
MDSEFCLELLRFRPSQPTSRRKEPFLKSNCNPALLILNPLSTSIPQDLIAKIFSAVIFYPMRSERSAQLVNISLISYSPFFTFTKLTRCFVASATATLSLTKQSILLLYLLS